MIRPIDEEPEETETRQIICEGGDEVLGELTFPKGYPEDLWARALSGYGCENHPPPPPEPSELERQMTELEAIVKQLDTVVTDVDARLRLVETTRVETRAPTR